MNKEDIKLLVITLMIFVSCVGVGIFLFTFSPP